MSDSGWRLRGELRGRPLAFEIPAAGGVLGSDPSCDLVLADPTISRRHAELRPVADGVAIRDLGSTNGTWVDGRRVEASQAAAGQPILFGRVRLVPERVAPADRELALPLPRDSDTGSDGLPGSLGESSVSLPRPADVTLGLGPVDAFALEEVPALLRLLHGGADATEVAQAAGAAALASLPIAELELRRTVGGVLFRGGTAAPTSEEPAVEVQVGGVTARGVFFQPAAARSLKRIVEGLATLVELAATRALPARPVAAPSPTAATLPGPPTVDQAVREIFRQATRVAVGDIGVLILGESGTGKEVMARYLHDASPRESFLALNCAALPRDLLEAELFGVEKGTATGVEARPGKLELAHGGTLFLDEIGDMSLDTQAKILRVLQEGEVYRLGGSQPRPARARVLAATNKDVAGLIAAGTFRVDLYHRIAGWVVELPPLRLRSGDIPNLAAYFLAQEGKRLGRRFRGISRAALEALLAYDWPGNIRQLQQEVARCALFMEDGDTLESGLLGAPLRGAAGGAEGGGPATLPERLERFERGEIQRALAASGGQVASAAERLGVHRATLYRRIKALGIGGDEEEDG